MGVAVGQLDAEGVLDATPAHKRLASELVIRPEVRPFVFLLILIIKLFMFQHLRP